MVKSSYTIANAKTHNFAILAENITDSCLAAGDGSPKVAGSIWEITQLPNYRYKIRSQDHGLHAAVERGGGRSGETLAVVGKDAVELWDITPVGPNEYHISNGDNKYWGLDVNDIGTPLTLMKYNNDRKLVWRFSPVTDGPDVSTSDHSIVALNPTTTQDILALLNSVHHNVQIFAAENLKLKIRESGYTATIGRDDLLPVLRLLRSDNPEVRATAASVIESIADYVPEMIDVLEKDAIPALVPFLRSDNIVVMKSGARALHKINQRAEAFAAAVDTHAIPCLLTVLSTPNIGVPALIDTCEVLKFFTTPDRAQNSATLANAIPILLRHLSSTDYRLQNLVADILHTITEHWDKRTFAVRASVVPQLVAILTSSDNSEVLVATCGALRFVDWSVRAARRENLIPALVRLLTSDKDLVQWAASTAMRSVTTKSVQWKRNVDAEHIPKLLTLVANSDDDDIVIACCIAVQHIHLESGSQAVGAEQFDKLLTALTTKRLLDSPDRDVQKSAVTTLNYLSGTANAHAILADIKVMTRLVRHLSSSDIGVVKAVCGILTNCSMNVEQPRIAAWKANAIPTLIRLLEDARVQVDAEEALENVILYDPAKDVAAKLLRSVNSSVLEGLRVYGVAHGVNQDSNAINFDQASQARKIDNRPIVHLARAGSVDVRREVKEALPKLLQHTVEDAALCADDIPGLVRLAGSINTEVQCAACEELVIVMSDSEDARIAALEANVMPLVTRLLALDNIDVQTKAFKLVALVTHHIPADTAVNLVPVLTRLLGSENFEIQRSTVGVFAIMADHQQVHAKAPDSGVIPSLVQLLKSTDVEVQQNSVTSLWKIARHTPVAAVVLETDAITTLVQLLGSDNVVVREKTAAALQNICRYPPAASSALASNALPALVRLLVSDDDAVQEKAAGAMQNITGYLPAAAAALEAKAIPALVQLLATDNSHLLRNATGALWRITEHPPAKVAALESNAIPALVPLLGLEGVQQTAAAALWSIAEHPPAQAVALKSGAIPALVTLLNSDNINVHKNAAGAIWRISEDAQAKAAARAAIPGLQRLLASKDAQVSAIAKSALNNVKRSGLFFFL